MLYLLISSKPELPYRTAPAPSVKAHVSGNRHGKYPSKKQKKRWQRGV